MSIRYMRAQDMKRECLYMATVQGEDNVLVAYNGKDVLSFKPIEGKHSHHVEEVAQVRPAAMLDSLGSGFRNRGGETSFAAAPFAEALTVEQWNQAFAAPSHVTYLHNPSDYDSAPVGTIAGHDNKIVKVTDGRWFSIRTGDEFTSFETFKKVVHWGDDTVTEKSAESVWGSTVLVEHDHDNDGVLPYKVTPLE